MVKGFKLFDDDNSACDNGTSFRVSYFVSEIERFLYFRTKDGAFIFVQNHPEADRPEIKDCATFETLFPVKVSSVETK